MSFVALVSVLMVAACRGADEVFWQELSFRSTFPGITGSQISGAWEPLPMLVAAGKQSLASLAPQRGCVLALSADGGLFGAARVKAGNGTDGGGDFDLASLSSPFFPWRPVGNVGEPAQRLIRAPGQDAVYVLTVSNIVKVTFAEGGTDACGIIEATARIIATDTIAVADATGLTAAPAFGSLFFGTAAGVFEVDVVEGSLRPVPRAGGGGCTALLFVPAWSVLVVGGSDAVRFLTFDPATGLVTHASHEWVGGNVDSVPLDLAYDPTGGAAGEAGGHVWLVEAVAAHRYSRNGRWDRFGFHQGAPMQNLSSVACHGGAVFIGSAVFGVSRLVNAVPAQNDGPDDEAYNGGDRLHPDPWNWAYYFGPRYLPGNAVWALFAEDDVVANGTQQDASAFVVTDSGLTYLNLRPWTLATKAAAFWSFEEPRHNRYGLSAWCDLDAFGDLSSYQPSCSDNDGVFTMLTLAMVH
jgi:hypothetical protein